MIISCVHNREMNKINIYISTIHKVKFICKAGESDMAKSAIHRDKFTLFCHPNTW
jgi:hypothetical protein